MGLWFGALASAQTKPAGAPSQRPAQVAVPQVPPAASAAATDYVIGSTDVLSIVFWGEKELSTDVTVRPDGKISLPLINDVVAAGLTPEQLRGVLAGRAKRFLESPVVTVVVKEVN
ncbi:MAG: polysaccharide biosynthesis/export family protein, partial [Acidobacteria bacterium]|nr:polysaccharide biosynthesis/export family protein [Acidobacteriota bacterium]